VTFAPETPVGTLLLAQPRAAAAEALFGAIIRYPENRPQSLLPILRWYDGEGSTDEVRFLTRKAVIPTTKSPVDHVVLDGPKGNTWEEAVAGLLEANLDVAAYVKNDHLDFSILYVHEGRSHRYVPDFLVRLVRQADDPVETRTLILEVSGGLKSVAGAGATSAKAMTARNLWCTAVNNHGGFGRWGYTEITAMAGAGAALDEAIHLLRSDTPITGDLELTTYPRRV
jgi:type III restriction enzyme